jgi:hypothetical protein
MRLLQSPNAPNNITPSQSNGSISPVEIKST